MNLKGHRALVTGATGGLGSEFALQLAEAGADLFLTSRDATRLDALSARIEREFGVRVERLAADLLHPGSPRALFSAARASGEITILINCAGTGAYGLFLGTPLDSHLSSLRLNAGALTELCHHFGSAMAASGKTGHVLNVSALAGVQGSARLAAYSASKSYVLALSETLGRELAGTPVSVTCVCPGRMATGFHAANGSPLAEEAPRRLPPTQAVAREALFGMLKRKSVVVPGRLNRIAAALILCLPRPLRLSLAFAALNRRSGPKRDVPMP